MDLPPAYSELSSLLTAHGLSFKARRLPDGWDVVVGDAEVGFLQIGDLKSWQAVELFVRGAGAQLYGRAF